MMSPTADDTRSLSKDEVYRLLSERWRRYALYCLFLYTTPVSLASVADTVTEFEYGVPAEEVPDERLEVYMQLYHTHVPKLDAAGVIDYDETDDTLAPDSGLSQLEPHLRSAARDELDEDTSWPVER